MDHPQPSAHLADHRAANLAKANAVRVRRSETRAHLKQLGPQGGALEAAGLIEDPPAFLATLPLFRLLGQVPKLGRLRVRHRPRERHRWAPWLRELDIPVEISLGEMTPRQRSALAGRLRQWAADR
jgi:hypothetical protein